METYELFCVSPMPVTAVHTRRRVASVVEIHMAAAEDFRETWYEASMASREQELANIFGPSSPASQVFKPADQNFELNVPGFAFLRYPPAANRPFWLYVTHGMAQPAEFEDFCDGFAGGGSGFGIEFAVATAAEETWPFSILEMLADYVLSSSKPIFPGDRIPVSDLMEEAPGGGLMVLPTPSFPDVKTLSGTFRFVQLVGITARELNKAKSHPGRVGSQILELVLRNFGVGVLTDRKRACATTNPDFDRIWPEMCLRVVPEK